jgi:hypothetical protein
MGEGQREWRERTTEVIPEREVGERGRKSTDGRVE